MLNFWSHNLLNGIVFTIKASPETATVQINGKVRNSVAVAPRNNRQLERVGVRLLYANRQPNG